MNSREYLNLQELGLLSYSSEFGAKEAFLTEKGNQYAVSDKYIDDEGTGFRYRYIKVKAAKMEFGEILGILAKKELNLAQVDYTLIRKDITPFGRIVFKLDEKTINNSVTFAKYDDGWRIANN